MLYGVGSSPGHGMHGALPTPPLPPTRPGGARPAGQHLSGANGFPWAGVVAAVLACAARAAATDCGAVLEVACGKQCRIGDAQCTFICAECAGNHQQALHLAGCDNVRCLLSLVNAASRSAATARPKL